MLCLEGSNTFEEKNRNHTIFFPLPSLFMYLVESKPITNKHHKNHYTKLRYISKIQIEYAKKNILDNITDCFDKEL